MRWTPLTLAALLIGCTGTTEKDPSPGTDADNDGHVALADGGDDCDDADNTVNPDAFEVCNGKDDDCDGLADDDDGGVDLGTASAWYTDADGDAFGDATASVRACAQPTGTVADSTDCNDDDDAINPGELEACNGIDDDCDLAVDEAEDVPPDQLPRWYPDADGDSFGANVDPTLSCTAPAGEVAVTGDCDDANDAVRPDAAEICNGGVDDDCSGAADDNDANVDLSTGATWYADVDGDDFGDAAAPTRACAAPPSHVADATDCDDNAGDVYPGAPEVCGGIDEDCDTLVDDDDPDVDPTTAVTWYADDDGDSYGDDAHTQVACSQPADHVARGGDCDDANDDVRPGAAEVCDGGVDDDCDTLADDDDPGLDLATAETWYLDADGDTWGDPDAPAVACVAPADHVARAGDCGDDDGDVRPDAAEVCNGGVDDDCDTLADDDDPGLDLATAETWYADLDGDTWGDPDAPTQACLVPANHTSDASDCDDGSDAVRPDAIEVCNDGVDDDCDTLVDDADDDLDLATAGTFYADLDGDTWGVEADVTVACVAPADTSPTPGDCDDTSDAVRPDAVEVCNDGLDDDCDTLADDADDGLDLGTATTWYADGDEDGAGDPDTTALTCVAPAGFVINADDCDDDDPAAVPGAEDVCDGSDNDCDGVVDAGVRVPSDLPDLNTAIAAVGDGGVVCLEPGVFDGDVDLQGHTVTITSQQGPGATTLLGTGTGPVVTATGIPAPGATLRGVTITGGEAFDGAGVYTDAAALTLEDVHIVGNTCVSPGFCQGTGLSSLGTDLTLRRVRIADNIAAPTLDAAVAFGGGALLIGGALTFEDLEISGNVLLPDSPVLSSASGAGLYALDADISGELLFVMNNGLEVHNLGTGGGLHLVDCEVDVAGALFEGNTVVVAGDGAVSGAGGAWYATGTDATLTDVNVNASLVDVVTTGTQALSNGAGVFHLNGALSVQLAAFGDNHAAATSHGDARATGGALYTSGADVTLIEVGTGADRVSAYTDGGEAAARGALWFHYGGDLLVAGLDGIGDEASAEGTTSRVDGGAVSWDLLPTPRGGSEALVDGLWLRDTRAYAGGTAGVARGGALWLARGEADVGWLDVRGAIAAGADVAGAGALLHSGQASLRHAIIAGNTAGDGTAERARGGGLQLGAAGATAATVVTITQADVVGNVADAVTDVMSGGLHLVASDPGDAVAVAGVNFAFNDVLGPVPLGAEIGAEGPFAITYEHSNLWSQAVPPVWDVPAPDPTLGNLFVDPAYTRITPGNPVGWDLHLEPGSLCIDAGPLADLDPDGTRADIGAYGGAP